MFINDSIDLEYLIIINHPVFKLSISKKIQITLIMMNSITIVVFTILLLCSSLPLKMVDCWPTINDNDNVKQQPQQKIEQDIAVKQIKACELDPECFGCWKIVDKQLLAKATSSDSSSCRFPAWRSSSFIGDAEQDYCCQLWLSFDCRTEIATKHCILNGYIKYSRHMIEWANQLMSENICTKYEYESDKCKQKNFILNEFDDVRQFM